MGPPNVETEGYLGFSATFDIRCKIFAKPLNLSATPASNSANGDSLSRSPSPSLDGISGSPKPESLPGGFPRSIGQFFARRSDARAEKRGQPWLPHCHKCLFTRVSSALRKYAAIPLNFMPRAASKTVNGDSPFPFSVSTPWTDVSGSPKPEYLARWISPDSTGHFFGRRPAWCQKGWMKSLVSMVRRWHKFKPFQALAIKVSPGLELPPASRI